MPILTIKYRNFNASASADDDAFARQKVRMSSLSLPIQKLTLCGYSVVLREHGSGSSAVIPDHLLIEIDGLTTQQVNNVSPPKSHNGDDFILNHHIPLPLSSDLTTIQFGMGGLDFEINKRLDREFFIHIKKFDANHNVISMTTSTNSSGQVAVDHVILYFNYNFVGNF